jgi:hypothetical protein
MAESKVIFKTELFNYITDTFKIPLIGGTEAQRSDYKLAYAAATCVADHVVATGNEELRKNLLQHSSELAKLGFQVGRTARDEGVVDMITPHTVSGFTPYTEVDVVNGYIRNAVNHIAQRKGITDLESDDVFRTRSGGTITVRELLEKAVQQDTFPGGATGRFR